MAATEKKGYDHFPVGGNVVKSSTSSLNKDATAMM